MTGSFAMPPIFGDVSEYVGKNPERANLRESEYVRWIRPDWDALGWRFISGDGRS